MRAECTALAAELRVTDRVEFVGIASEASVIERLARADVFVQHCVKASDGDMEGAPVSICEAMASGLAVVTTRHAGIVDLMREAKTGFLCDEHDWRTMADRMVTLAKDSEMRRRFGLAARERMAREFNARGQAGKISQLLLSAAQRR